MSITKEQLIDLLRDNEFRGHFTSDQVYELLAVQIRQLREKHRWTQTELGDRAGMQQVQVSRAENPDYKGARISTLSKLADAFDVALIVRLAPFSELIDWVAKLSPASFAPPSFDEELQSAATRMALPREDSTETQIPSRTFAPQGLLFTAIEAEDVPAAGPPIEHTAMPAFVAATRTERINEYAAVARNA
jgi:transcriptional regulator with XRE-family HTH domain